VRLLHPYAWPTSRPCERMVAFVDKSFCAEGQIEFSIIPVSTNFTFPNGLPTHLQVMR